MHWVVLAPFNHTDQDHGWLTPFVPGNDHTFRLLAPPGGGAKKSGQSNLSAAGWVQTWKHAARAWEERPGGIVTVFPALAVTAGLRSRLGRADVPIVAWCFNMGRLYFGLRGMAARFGLRHVRRFIVHSRAEVKQYSQWLDLPPEKFEFVHLQRPFRQITHEEDRDAPFVLAMGSANRDYGTFFSAVARLGCAATVVAAPYALAGLDVPPNVTVKSGLTYDQCLELAQRARVSVVPVANHQTASGQVTVIDAMRLRRPLVATRCIGTEDYVRSGETGLLVEPGSVDDLADAIQRLWDDEALRRTLGRKAHEFAREHCSDEVAGRTLKRVLDEVWETD